MTGSLSKIEALLAQHRHESSPAVEALVAVLRIFKGDVPGAIDRLWIAFRGANSDEEGAYLRDMLAAQLAPACRFSELNELAGTVRAFGPLEAAWEAQMSLTAAQ